MKRQSRFYIVEQLKLLAYGYTLEEFLRLVMEALNKTKKEGKDGTGNV